MGPDVPAAFLIGDQLTVVEENPIYLAETVRVRGDGRGRGPSER